jgi:hypothetical protein
MKAQLDEEMGTPPPSLIDVEALVSRGRRQVRLRRFVAAGGGAGLSVVALGAVVAVALNASGPAGAPAGFGAAPASSVSVSPTPPGGKPTGPTGSEPPQSPPGSMRPVTEGQAAAEQRLTNVVKALVQQYAPGAVASKDGSGREPLKVRVGSAFNSAAKYDASANLTVGDGQGQFYIGIGDNQNIRTDCDGGFNDGSGRTCTKGVGPAGESIVRIVEPTDDKKNKAFLVYIVRTDNTGIFLTADDGNDFGNRAGTRAEPVFTHDQLVAMGTDPRWTLYP